MGRKQSITVNGVSYDSIDDVPEPHRSQLRGVFADHDGDGVPDIIQGRADAAVETTMTSATMHTNQFVVDGVSYDSLDDVPEPHRSTIERQLADTIPGMFAAAGHDTRSATVAAAVPAPSASRPVVSRAGWSTRTKLLAAFVVADIAVLALVVVLLTR